MTRQRSSLFLGSGTLLGQENRLDVGQNSTLGDGHASQELVQLLVVPALSNYILYKWNKMVNSPDGQLEVPWDNARLLVVPGSITSKLKDLGGQVLHDSSHVDGSSSTHPLGIVSLPVRQEF